MAIQFFVLIALGAWLGQQADKRLGTSSPFFTIGLILLFATGFFYVLIKDLNRKDEP
jgi:F0F1-type ATP synthase assembly protein I